MHNLIFFGHKYLFCVCEIVSATMITSCKRRRLFPFVIIRQKSVYLKCLYLNENVIHARNVIDMTARYLYLFLMRKKNIKMRQICISIFSSRGNNSYFLFPDYVFCLIVSGLKLSLRLRNKSKKEREK